MQIQQLSGYNDNPTYLRTFRTVEDDSDEKRLGILIGAKVDMYQISKNLRWGYLPDEKLKSYGISQAEVTKLKNELRKAEKLYEAEGGTRLQFARAILEGHGNADKLVAVDYNGIGNVAVGAEERVLSMSPAAIIQLLKSQSALGSVDNAADSVAKASDTLLKIGTIASSVGVIATQIGSSAKSSATPATATPAVAPSQAGIGAWLGENKILAAGGLIAALGFAVTRMNVPKEEMKGFKNPVKRKTATRKTASRKTATRKKPAARKATARRKGRESLGIIPLM